jgi:hypothetical protein
MDTGHRSARRPAGGDTRRTSPGRMKDVTAILASTQLPGLPPEAADRIRRALAAESAGRAAADDAGSYAAIRIPRPRSGKALPPLTHLVPRPRHAPAAV